METHAYIVRVIASGLLSPAVLWESPAIVTVSELHAAKAAVDHLVNLPLRQDTQIDVGDELTITVKRVPGV